MYFLNRLLQKPGPSFFPSWNSQKYGELPQDFRTSGGRFLVAGLPKSGNVWLTSLIASCLDLPAARRANRSHAEYTHKALGDAVLYDPEIYRGVVIVRDLRDVVVSLYHWLPTEDYLSYYKHGPHQVFDNIEDMYVEYFLRRFAKIDIAHLVDDYVTRGWPVIKYEALWDEPHQQLARLLKIWLIEVSKQKIAEAVSANSIDRLKKEFDPKRSRTIDRTIRKDHFRTGGYGQYKKELPAWIIRDIEARYGDYLRSWGYETKR